jgi:hypothetical protein
VVEIRASRAAAAAAAGGDGKPAADADGKARRRRRSRDSSRTRPSRESEGSAEARDAPAEGPVEAAQPQSPAAALRDAMSKSSCWSAVLYYVDAVVQSPDTVLPALGSATRLAVQVREVPHLRADPRFEQLLRAVEQLLPAMDARGLAAVLGALARLRVSPSDDTLRRVLDACAARSAADFRPAELGRLRAAGAALGWAMPAPLLPRRSRGAAEPPRPTVRELFGEELHAQKAAIHKRGASWPRFLGEQRSTPPLSWYFPTSRVPR